jgi:hypothetical protein
MNVRARVTLLMNRVLERLIIAQAGAGHFVGVGPNVEEATQNAARGLSTLPSPERPRPGGGCIMLSVIGELRVGTSPRPVMATRLIGPEEQVRAAGWDGELP